MKQPAFPKIIYILTLLMLICNDRLDAQIIITKDEIPVAAGTVWTTLNDTTGDAAVDVGLAGENQQWEFTQAIDGAEINQAIVPIGSTPFASDFTEADFVIKHESGILDLFYGSEFPQIEGDVYFYQQLADNAVVLYGSGFFSGLITGASRFEPDGVIINFLPAQYNDHWSTQSQFTIVKDTTIMGIPGRYEMVVNDSSQHSMDAWGKVKLPYGEFECLRMKSYINMNSQIIFNNIPISVKNVKAINYNWIAEYYGIVIRITSHNGEQDDNFNKARILSRMNSFSPEPTAISNENPVSIKTYELDQNYPNPFNSSTAIAYRLPGKCSVSLKIYNLLGQEINTLVNTIKSEGAYKAFWSGKDKCGRQAPSGIYVCCLSIRQANQTQITKYLKMSLIK